MPIDAVGVTIVFFVFFDGMYPVLAMRSAIAVYRPNWIPAEQVFNIIMIDYPSSTNPNWISTAEKYTLAGVKKTNGD